MRVERSDISREEVIRFYSEYDRQKKGELPLADLDLWPWDDSYGLDRKLDENGLKDGVLAAYRNWKLVELGVADLLQCAIVNHIFPGEPQSLGQLVLRGKLAGWLPLGSPAWWRQLESGSQLNAASALILRPALNSEAPAKWYTEDGSGRALAVLQRILRYGELERTVWAYLGDEPDGRSEFIRSRQELAARARS